MRTDWPGDVCDCLVRVSGTGVGLVTGAPTIAADAELYTVKEGEKLELGCSATGDPTPSIAWHRNGRPLLLGPDYALHVNWFTTALS